MADVRPATLRPMPLSRRTFLKTASTAAALTLSGSVGPRAHVRLTQQTPERKEFHMDIKRAGSQPSRKGTTDWFTGTVRIDPLFEGLCDCDALVGRQIVNSCTVPERTRRGV